MSERIHFIVAKSRDSWSVNVEADRLSEHRRREDARAEAEMLTNQAEWSTSPTTRPEAGRNSPAIAAVSAGGARAPCSGDANGHVPSL